MVGGVIVNNEVFLLARTMAYFLFQRSALSKQNQARFISCHHKLLIYCLMRTDCKKKRDNYDCKIISDLQTYHTHFAMIIIIKFISLKYCYACIS